MKVIIDFVELRDVLAKVLDKGVDCNNCPYAQRCDGCEDSNECAEVFIGELAKEKIYQARRYY